MADLSISIVVPLWNGKHLIQTCLSRLFASSLLPGDAFEVIVVDNGSQDGSGDVVSERFPAARLIRLERNLGFAGGCNVGLRAAHGDILVLLNQDTQVEPDWLATLAAALSDATVGVVGGLALLPDGAHIQHAGGVIDWPLGVARHRGYGEPVSGPWLQATDVPFVTGAGLATRRDVLATVGLLDEAFRPGYYEDADLCWRVRDAGYSVRYTPEARLVHQESASFADPRLRRWAQLRGRLRFCLKHLPPQTFLEEFLPAERRYRASVLAGDHNGVMARAYLEAIPMALTLWTAEAPERVRAVVAGLADLYGEPGLDPLPAAEPEPLTPVLTPSSWERIPLAGAWLHRLRASLHRLIIFYVARRESTLVARLHAQAERIRALEAALARASEEH